MDSNPRTARNDSIFSECISGARFSDLAREQGISARRIYEIFETRARQRYPELFYRVTSGRGFRVRFITALLTNKSLHE